MSPISIYITRLLERKEEYLKQCTRCGKCCTKMCGMAIDPMELERLCEHLGVSEDEFRQNYDMLNFSLPFDGKCPFLGDDNLCTVYEARPGACRGFPFVSIANDLEESNKLDPPQWCNLWIEICKDLATFLHKELEMRYPNGSP